MSEKHPFNWLFPVEMLDNSPSRSDGYSKEIERQYRSKCVFFIENLSNELKCERNAMSTACVLFHRFYVFQSFGKHNRFIISATCLFLACKVEECYRSVKDIAHVYEIVRRRSPNFNAELECKGLIEQILLAERILLQTLCFDLQITHPHSSCIQKIKLLRSSIPEDLRKEFYQRSVNFINDSYRTNLCVLYPPQYIAISSMFMATLHLSLNIPMSPKSSKEQTWFQLLQTDISEEALKDICFTILKVYEDSTTVNQEVSRSLQSKLLNLSELNDQSYIATVTPDYSNLKDTIVPISSNNVSLAKSTESKSIELAKESNKDVILSYDITETNIVNVQPSDVPDANINFKDNNKQPVDVTEVNINATDKNKHISNYDVNGTKIFDNSDQKYEINGIININVHDHVYDTSKDIDVSSPLKRQRI